jgi:hypothetical protein
VFELARLPSPGKSTLQSVTVKALERRGDGVIVPEAPDQPLTIVEFQFQADDTICRRTVVEMAAVQNAFPGRVVQGVIREEIAKLTAAEAKRIMQFLARRQSLDEATPWLARAKTKGRGSKRGRN